MSGCVLPVGPQFDDPEPNFPPFIFTSDPAVGEVFTFQEGHPITVTIGDHNVGDELFMRWLVDYPNSDLNNARRADENSYLSGTTITRSPPLQFSPLCASIPRGANPHRLLLSISDRPFLRGDQVSPAAPFDTVPAGANRLRAVWLMRIDCPGASQ